MKYFKRIIFFQLLSGLFFIQAQDISIKAYVSKSNLTTEDRLQYTVEISGAKSMKTPDVDFPDFKDFFVLFGPSSSSSMQIINGAVSSSNSLTYTLKPRKEGTLAIGSASVEIDGTEYTTDPITVTVTKAAPGQQTEPQPSQQRSDAQISTDNLFLRTEVSKRKLYLGEQLTVEYKLYFKVNARSYDIEKLPTNTGFWSENFDLPSRPVIENQVINGVNYNVALLSKVALFPTQVGELTLDPMGIVVDAALPSRRSRRSLFDSFFDQMDRTVRKELSSRPIKIEVLPLPQNKPASFNGAVGQFNISAEVDKQKVNVNEAISLKIKVSGTGNLKVINIPEINIPPDIERYDPKINSSISKKNNRISGLKTAEYILIPRIPGEYSIKSIEFSYFDPSQKKYVTKTTGFIPLYIGGEAAASASQPNYSNLSRQEVALLGRDIRFIKLEADLDPVAESRVYLSWPYLSGFVLSLFLFIAFLFWDEKNARVQGDQVLARRKRAGKIASKFLADAKSKINNKEKNDFYKALNLALVNFVQDKLNLELSDFNTASIKIGLKTKSIPEELIEDYTNLLNTCDFQQFASASEQEDRKQLLDNAREIIIRLEKYI